MIKRKTSRGRSFYRTVRHRTKKMTIPLAPIAGIAGAPFMGYTIQSVMVGDFIGALKNVRGIAGIDFTGKFRWDMLQANWTPILAGLMVHKLASATGVNRALASAKLPYLRL